VPSDRPERQTPVDPAWRQAFDGLFAFDELHVRQKVLAIAQKYTVTDSWGRPRFYVVRPPRLALNAILGISLTLMRLCLFLGVVLWVSRTGMQPGTLAVGIAFLAVTGWVLGLGAVLASPYRHIEVFRDESQAWRLLTITQDNKLGVWRRYTLYDCFGQEVARLRRNTFKSILRREWIVEGPSGEPLLAAREDSWTRALMRRYLGPLWGALRTNFNFEFPDGRVFGKYDRKLSLIDDYVLDLGGDTQRRADRRALLAMAILLDTGEMR